MGELSSNKAVVHEKNPTMVMYATGTFNGMPVCVQNTMVNNYGGFTPTEKKVFPGLKVTSYSANAPIPMTMNIMDMGLKGLTPCSSTAGYPRMIAMGFDKDG